MKHPLDLDLRPECPALGRILGPCLAVYLECTLSSSHMRPANPFDVRYLQPHSMSLR